MPPPISPSGPDGTPIECFRSLRFEDSPITRELTDVTEPVKARSPSPLESIDSVESWGCSRDGRSPAPLAGSPPAQRRGQSDRSLRDAPTPPLRIRVAHPQRLESFGSEGSGAQCAPVISRRGSPPLARLGGPPRMESFSSESGSLGASVSAVGPRTPPSKLKTPRSESTPDVLSSTGVKGTLRRLWSLAQSVRSASSRRDTEDDEPEQVDRAFVCGSVQVETRGIIGTSYKQRWVRVKARWLEEYPDRASVCKLPTRSHDLYCASLRPGATDLDIEVVGSCLAPPGYIRLRAEDAQSAAQWREGLQEALESVHCDPSAKSLQISSCLRDTSDQDYDERRKARVQWLVEGLSGFYQRRGGEPPDTARLAEQYVFEEFRLYVRLAVRYPDAKKEGWLQWMLAPPASTLTEPHDTGEHGVDVEGLERHEQRVCDLERRLQGFYQRHSPAMLGQERSVAQVFVGREWDLRRVLQKHHESDPTAVSDLDRLLCVSPRAAMSRAASLANPKRKAPAPTDIEAPARAQSVGEMGVKKKSVVQFDPKLPEDRPHIVMRLRVPTVRRSPPPSGAL